MRDISEAIEALLDPAIPLPVSDAAEPLYEPQLVEKPAFTDLVEGLVRGTRLIEERKRGQVR